jgi:phage-related protein
MQKTYRMALVAASAFVVVSCNAQERLDNIQASAENQIRGEMTNFSNEVSDAADNLQTDVTNSVGERVGNSLDTFSNVAADADNQIDAVQNSARGTANQTR